MLLSENTISELDPNLAQAIEAMQILISRYCGNKPVFEQALDAWRDETTQEAVFEMAIKEKKTPEDLSKVKFNRVALDFMVIEGLTNLAHTMEDIKAELTKINFVIDDLCRDAGVTKI